MLPDHRILEELMKKFTLYVSWLTMLAVSSGCVTTKPLISHAHIGHAMTTWHDTPDQQGLLATAEARAEQAWQHMNTGCRSSEPEAAGQALSTALRALSPELVDANAAGEYGAARALLGAIDHIEFAAASKDASTNMIVSVAQLSASGTEIAEAMLQVAVDLRQNLASGRVQCRQLVDRMRAILGETASDGAATKMGMRQFRTQLAAMLARETEPPYEPVSRRYVLGLVRLPTGRWDFRLGPPPKSRGASSYGFGPVGY